MNRKLTALFAALEALLVVGIGIGIPLVPLTLMWAFQYGLQVDWLLFWRSAVDIWLLGHGAHLSVVLDAAAVNTLALPGAATPFALTLAPLAFAIVTVLLGTRAGRRIGETPHLRIGQLAAVAVFGALAWLASVSALSAALRPSLVEGCLLPTLVFAVGIAIGSGSRRRTLAAMHTATAPPSAPKSPASNFSEPKFPAPKSPTSRSSTLGRSAPRLLAPRSALGQLPNLSLSRLDLWLRDRVPRQRSLALIAVAGGIAATALVLLIAAITVAVLLAANYAPVIAIYEGVHSGILGGVALTLGQLALIPNTIIWAAAWFVGPGFSIGTGSMVSPLGTLLGPIPAIPILGALPSATANIGFLGLLVPVLAGFVVGLFLRGRLVAAGCVGMRWILVAGGATGLTAGVLLGGLSALSGGAAGPGRLADVGPSWLPVALWSALEIALPVVIALAASRDLRGTAAERSPRVGRAVPDAAPAPAAPAPATPASTAPAVPAPAAAASSTPPRSSTPPKHPKPSAAPAPLADDTVTAEIPIQRPATSPEAPVELSPEPPAAQR